MPGTEMMDGELRVFGDNLFHVYHATKSTLLQLAGAVMAILPKYPGIPGVHGDNIFSEIIRVATDCPAYRNVYTLVLEDEDERMLFGAAIKALHFVIKDC